VKTKKDHNQITREIAETIKVQFKKIASRYKVELTEYTYTDTYIQFSISAIPNSDLVRFINAFKSASSRVLKLHMSGNLWSKGYCLLTEAVPNKDNIIKHFLSRVGTNEDKNKP
jgi:putative transposase